MGLLLAAAADESGAAGLRALRTLQEAGAEVVRLHLGPLLPADGLAGWATEVAEDPPGAALSGGG